MPSPTIRPVRRALFALGIVLVIPVLGGGAAMAQEASVSAPATEPAVGAPNLPIVDGITWGTPRSLAGVMIDSEIEGGLREILDLLLAESGASYAGAAMLEATAFASGVGGSSEWQSWCVRGLLESGDAPCETSRIGHTIGTYLPLSIEGADATALAPLLRDYLVALHDAAEDEHGEVTVAGKLVRVVAAGGTTLVIYGEGNTLHLINMRQEEPITKVLEAIP